MATKKKVSKKKATKKAAKPFDPLTREELRRKAMAKEAK